MMFKNTAITACIATEDRKSNRVCRDVKKVLKVIKMLPDTKIKYSLQFLQTSIKNFSIVYVSLKNKKNSKIKSYYLM